MALPPASHAALGATPALQASVAQTQTDALLGRLKEAAHVLGAHGANWGLNLLNAAGRDGAITLGTTLLREIVNEAASVALLHASPTTRTALSASIVGATGLLNVTAFVYQHAHGQGNRLTRSAQAANLALLTVGSTVAARSGVFGQVAPQLLKCVAYAASRDGLNLLLRLNANRRPDAHGISGMQLFTEMASYAINQYLINELQGLPGSASGSSLVGQHRSVGDIARHLSAFAAANAAGETLDAVAFPAIIAFYDGLRNSMQQGLREVRDLRLRSTLHVGRTPELPEGSALTSGWLREAPTREEAIDKLFGGVAGRQSAFIVLFLMLDALSKAGPAAGLDEKGSAHLTNALAGLSIGVLAAAFIGMVSISPRRSREADVELAAITPAVPGNEAPADAAVLGRPEAAVLLPADAPLEATQRLRRDVEHM